MIHQVYIKTEGTTEPVSISELSDYVGYNGSSADYQAILNDLNTAARLKMEKYTGRNFVEKTMVLMESEITNNIKLPYGPINAVTSVKIYDEYGELDETLVADDDYYLLYDFDKVVKLESFFSGSYMSIEYTAGWGDNTFTLPVDIKTAIMKQVKFDFDHRATSDVPLLTDSVKRILEGYRCSSL